LQRTWSSLTLGTTPLNGKIVSQTGIMCVLHVSGSQLDPATGVGLQPYRVHRAGDPRRGSRPDGPRWNTSGFSVIVSDAPWSDLKRQVSDACAFLDHHGDAIRTLKADGAVEDMRLDFPVHLRIGENIFAQFEFFPPDLVEKAGGLGLGLEISIYPPGQDGERLDDDAG
jgi:hypothetical protein